MVISSTGSTRQLQFSFSHKGTLLEPKLLSTGILKLHYGSFVLEKSRRDLWKAPTPFFGGSLFLAVGAAVERMSWSLILSSGVQLLQQSSCELRSVAGSAWRHFSSSTPSAADGGSIRAAASRQHLSQQGAPLESQLRRNGNRQVTAAAAATAAPAAPDAPRTSMPPSTLREMLYPSTQPVWDAASTVATTTTAAAAPTRAGTPPDNTSASPASSSELRQRSDGRDQNAARSSPPDSNRKSARRKVAEALLAARFSGGNAAAAAGSGGNANSSRSNGTTHLLASAAAAAAARSSDRQPRLKSTALVSPGSGVAAALFEPLQASLACLAAVRSSTTMAAVEGAAATATTASSSATETAAASAATAADADECADTAAAAAGAPVAVAACSASCHHPDANGWCHMPVHVPHADWAAVMAADPNTFSSFRVAPGYDRLQLPHGLQVRFL